MSSAGEKAQAGRVADEQTDDDAPRHWPPGAA
jgi:hypothetical protein